MNELFALEVTTLFTLFSTVACFLHEVLRSLAHVNLMQAVLALPAVLCSVLPVLLPAGCAFSLLL